MNAKRRVAGKGAFRVATAFVILVAALMITIGSSGCGNCSPSIEVFTSGTSKGSPSAPLIIIEYSDFQCYHCQEFALTTAKELEEAYINTGKVRLVFKHYVVYEEESMRAAQASECAAEQNKFWPYYDLLMQTQASPEEEDLTTAKLESFAQEVGLDVEAFSTCLECERYKEKVIRDKEEARAVGITGVPAFIVNDKKRIGYPLFEEFQAIIEPLLE